MNTTLKNSKILVFHCTLINNYFPRILHGFYHTVYGRLAELEFPIKEILLEIGFIEETITT